MNNSTFTGKRTQCPKCAASGLDNKGNNFAEYTDHWYCFACQHYEGKDGVTRTMETDTTFTSAEFKPTKGTVTGLSHRNIDDKTCRLYGYESAKVNGKEVEISNYYKSGTLVAQHLRGPNKQFFWKGNSRNVELFGQHLWKNGGKRLVITEGEIDCMTVNQLLGGTWPVVSIPNGAQSAVKAIKDNYEFVCSYSEIVLCFDNDEPGRNATKQVAELLPPGKCKIAKLPYKDANECLMNNNGKAVVSAIWEAQQYSPDEILHISSIVNDGEDIANVRVYPFPFDSLSEYLIGQRSGEITLWASGTGSGKSTILRELIIHHLEEGRSVGAIMLEESPQETMDDMISLLLNKPVRAIRACRMMNDLRVKLGKSPINMDYIDDLSDEEYADAKRKLSGTNFFIYDHLGNNAMQNLLARMEYMAVSLKVDVIVLDHITAAAAGLMGMHDKDTDGGNSERIIIDTLMKELRSLAVRTGVHVDIVSQLKKTDKAYEEGDRITLQDLRGSGALSSVPNTVVALERDRQNADETIANTTLIRVLKNRLTGRAGIATALYYDRKTGRLKEVGFAIDDGGQVVYDPNNNVTQTEGT
jgi:twinkle protein